MDLILWSASWPARILVDLTVRCPVAGRYLPAAASKPGTAIRMAIQEKSRRYQDDVVTCIAIEPWGRMGPEVIALLESLEKRLSDHQCHLASTVRGSRVRRWLTALQVALARAVAQGLRSAAGVA